MKLLFVFLILFSIVSVENNATTYTERIRILINKSMDIVSLQEHQPFEMIKQMSLFMDNEMLNLTEAYSDLMKYTLYENRQNDTDKITAIKLLDDINYKDDNYTSNERKFDRNSFLYQIFNPDHSFFERYQGYKTDLENRYGEEIYKPLKKVYHAFQLRCISKPFYNRCLANDYNTRTKDKVALELECDKSFPFIILERHLFPKFVRWCPILTKENLKIYTEIYEKMSNIERRVRNFNFDDAIQHIYYVSKIEFIGNLISLDYSDAMERYDEFEREIKWQEKNYQLGITDLINALRISSSRFSYSMGMNSCSMAVKLLEVQFSPDEFLEFIAMVAKDLFALNFFHVGCEPYSQSEGFEQIKEIYSHMINYTQTSFTLIWPSVIELWTKEIIESYSNKKEWGYSSETTSEIKFNANNIANDLGHASIVFKLKLTFELPFNDDLISETITVILKVPTTEYYMIYRNIPQEKEFSIAEMIARNHNQECDFYEKLAPLMKIKIPNIYETKKWDINNYSDDGYILMDDMSEEGVVLSKYDNVTSEQMKAVIQEIAHIQAEYFKLPNNIKPEAKSSPGWSPNGFIQQIPAFIELVDDKEKIDNDLKMIQEKVLENLDRLKTYHDLKLPSMLIHGDLWNGNLFFKKDHNGKASNEVLAIIDWPVARESSPVADITRYLLIDTDRPTRRAIEPMIPEFYLECLQSQIPDFPFTIDQIQKLYYRSFITQVCNFIGVTNFNVSVLQQCIHNSKDFALNFARKKMLIEKALDAIEDVVKIFDNDLADLKNA